MNLLRTREQRAHPVTSDAFEPFRIMRHFFRWDPYQDLGFPESALNTFMPSFDVEETEDAYQFIADLPGIRREDLDIQLAGNRLTIGGTRDATSTREQGKVYTQERSYGAFTRTFALPEEVESGKVVAELRDGVLRLMVPKSPEVRPQKIDIK